MINFIYSRAVTVLLNVFLKADAWLPTNLGTLKTERTTND